MSWHWLTLFGALVSQSACFDARNAPNSVPSERSADAQRGPPDRVTPTSNAAHSTQTVLVDQTLTSQLSAGSFAAYKLLLIAPSLVVGDRCGVAGEPTAVWQALTSLVHARETAILRDLSARASTFEGRGAAVIGLVKLGAISKGEASALLASLHGSITTCAGCLVYVGTPSSDIMYLFDVPLLGDPWEGANLEVLELPGAVPNLHPGSEAGSTMPTSP